MSCRLSLSLVVFSFLLLFGYSSIINAKSNPVSLSNKSINIAKGKIDQREYYYFVLPNQLQVLLISDKEADKAAASLDVHVGSSDDPKDREGLAHFLEHMLFLGTKKYPDPAEYQAYISANGGGHNAYTSAEHTNYHFDIDVKQLEPALDRFAQFFVAPLFDASYVDRERNAVHSEYQAKIKDDSRRGYDVYREVINPNHPYAKFSVGNLVTLADREKLDEPNKVGAIKGSIRKELLDFYAKHYSSDQMALVVLGMVEQRFSSIPQRNIESAEENIPLFPQGLLPIEVLSQPIKKYYGEKPFSYIGSLLGHEGKGSLLSLLKAQGWAEGLSAGGHDSGAGNAIFHISINLTEEGVKQREKIRALVFYAINVIKEKGIEVWRYNEEKQLAEIAFEFREKSRAMQTVRKLSGNLHDYPPEEVISGDYLYKKFDAKLIHSLLSKMTPQNLYVNTVLPEVKTDKVTHYYHVPYAVHSLPASIVDIPPVLEKQYRLPEKNIFVPQKVDLYAEDSALVKPVKLSLKPSKHSSSKESNKQSHELWVKQDIQFGVPKASISLRFLSPGVSQSIKVAANSQLLIAMVQDRLNENSYPASLAGLNYSFSLNARGFDLHLQGYNDKMGVLLKMIVDELRKPTLKNERFVNIKKELLRKLRNTKKLSPYKQLFQKLPETIFQPYWSNDQLADALEGATLKDVKRVAKDWRKGVVLKGLFYGNINKTSAQQWQQTIAPLLKRGKKSLTPVAVAKLPAVSPAEKNIKTDAFSVDHNDKAVGLYVQGLSDSIQDQAIMVLLRQVLDADFYSQLRTDQQLGYIVFLANMTIKEVPGSLFLVQSPSTSVEKIQKAMQEFIAQTFSALPDDLSVYQQSVNTRLLEKPQALSAQSNRYWGNIVRGDDSFSYRQRLADAVNQVTVKQLRDYYQNTLLNEQMLLWFIADRKASDQPLSLFHEKQPVYQYP